MTSNRVKAQTAYCLSMEPDDNISTQTSVLREKLGKLVAHHSDEPKQPKLRSGAGAGSDKKKLDNTFLDLANDLNRINKNFECLIECFYTILDKVDELSNVITRLDALEKRITKLDHMADQHHIVSPSANLTSLDKLEYSASEIEREKRLLQAVITHPNIDTEVVSLTDHMNCFFSDTMQMTSREIVTAFTVSKWKHKHTVLVNFSRKQFKTFLYAARKRLRQGDEQLSTGLYVNDNLTQYNYNLLKLLKNEKKRRIASKLPSIAAIFSFDGRIFAKHNEDSEKVYIRDTDSFDKFLQPNGVVSVTSIN